MENTELSARYDASLVETRWYQTWEDNHLFEPEIGSPRSTYSITIPPPNVTGSLHIGHALCYGLQDLFGRYKRLKGFNVMILPGQDHAGIATQGVVTKLLKKQGISPFEIGREKFLEHVWDWRRESGGAILRGFRALGCAFDWKRERFTLDEDYQRAVLKVFIDWFDRGLIYKGLRVVNWDPVLRTSVSDIETERKVVMGKLYHVSYPFEDGSGSVTIATTRPETILADVAVAVHPKDERYRGLVGKNLVLPLVGRIIPLIEDDYPDPEFGTGAVKITPGHDANDFEVGRRHGLEILIAIDDTGKMVDFCGEYAGLDRIEARKRVVADLEAQGNLVKVEDHEIALLISERSHEVIEPLASEQWFVDQKYLSIEAKNAVENGLIKFVPERYKGVYLEWMSNIRDWCISRQLWWGHRIPVYYTEDGLAVAALSAEEARQKIGKEVVSQDNDVLDTWFSSGLWPFATMGWPEQTEDLQTFYPTDLLVTSREILYLWVARMIMMGLDFTKTIPFHNVYIYATVLTEDGKRMSKSLGTGIDPMDVIEEMGADALRWTLFSQTGENQDIRYSARKITDARNFCNKIWNASRFVLLNLDGFEPSQLENLTLEDKWILSRLAKTEQEAVAGYESYNTQASTHALYRFFWNDLCDWYIEMVKGRLNDSETRCTPQNVLLYCLESFLKLAHPIIPFITEEIWSHLPHRNELLMASSWPEDLTKWLNDEAESKISMWSEAVRSLRALRAELNITPGQKVSIVYFEGELAGGETMIKSQAWIENLVEGKPSDAHISTSTLGMDFYLPTAGLIDVEKERARLEREIQKSNDMAESIQKRLSNPQFLEKAKPEVVSQAKEDLSMLESEIEKMKLSLNQLVDPGHPGA